MKETINRCPICSKIVSIESNADFDRIENINGITWDNIGYSIGGWGHRREFLPSFTGEVCDECFVELSNSIKNLKNVIEKRKESNKEGISIYRMPQNKTTSDKMSHLRKHELQPQRYKIPLLRLLSLFSR